MLGENVGPDPDPVDVVLVVGVVGEFMNRTNLFNSLLFNSLFSFLLLEEGVGPDVVARVDAAVDEVPDVAARLEDSQVTDVPFRLLDLSVFIAKSPIVFETSRLCPYASRIPNENLSFDTFGVAIVNDDICRGPVAEAKLWNPGCPGWSPGGGCGHVHASVAG